MGCGGVGRVEPNPRGSCFLLGHTRPGLQVAQPGSMNGQWQGRKHVCTLLSPSPPAGPPRGEITLAMRLIFTERLLVNRGLASRVVPSTAVSGRWQCNQQEHFLEPRFSWR